MFLIVLITICLVFGQLLRLSISEIGAIVFNDLVVPLVLAMWVAFGLLTKKFKIEKNEKIEEKTQYEQKKEFKSKFAIQDDGYLYLRYVLDINRRLKQEDKTVRISFHIKFFIKSEDVKKIKKKIN